MRIVDVCISHPDGHCTDEAGNPLTSTEAFMAARYRTHGGKDMFDLAYEAGQRIARSRERRIMLAILGQSMERDCNDLLIGRVG